MKLPNDVSLPLFVYGMLLPGELAYFRVKSHILRNETFCAPGSLHLRDGLVIAESGSGAFPGKLLYFKPETAQIAYQAVCDLEPDEQYRWDLVSTKNDGRANILWGRNPAKGSIPLDFEWSSWGDPLFTNALELVSEMLEEYGNWEWDLKNSFRIQMAYLLLWTSIERYASLRYHLGDKAHEKVLWVAEETAFAAKLAEVVKGKRVVQRADKPKQNVELDPSDPKKAMKYYYQVRSNMVHRGKGMPRDHEIVFSSCGELLKIFRHLLRIAKKDAEA